MKVDVLDCVGCGRCIAACPENVLSFSDVRDYFKKPIPSGSEAGRRPTFQIKVTLGLVLFFSFILLMLFQF